MSTSEKLFTIQVMFIIDNAPVIAKRLKISWSWLWKKRSQHQWSRPDGIVTKQRPHKIDLIFVENYKINFCCFQFSSVFVAQELTKIFANWNLQYLTKLSFTLLPLLYTQELNLWLIPASHFSYWSWITTQTERNLNKEKLIPNKKETSLFKKILSVPQRY